MSELHPEKSCCTTVGRGFDSPHLHHSCALLHEASRPGAGSRNGVELHARVAGSPGSAGASPRRRVIRGRHCAVLRRLDRPVFFVGGGYAVAGEAVVWLR